LIREQEDVDPGEKMFSAPLTKDGLVIALALKAPSCPLSMLSGFFEEIAVLDDSSPSDKAAERSGGGTEASLSLAASGRVWAGTATVRTVSDITPVLQILHDALQRNNFHAEEIDSIRLAVHEAIRNALKHGHQDDPGKQVRIRYLINHVGLLTQVEDEGPGFRPEWILQPRQPERQDRSQGRGLRLMLQHMSEVRYNPSGNCVTLVKRRSERA
jgi:serine/threonine-protein kinase RsbW